MENNQAEDQKTKDMAGNFLSEDFLQILEEHRKNCEKEGKL